MSVSPKNIFFNQHRALAETALGEGQASEQGTDFQAYANEPPVRLQQIEEFSKVQQHDIPGDLKLEIAAPVFGPSLTWAYRGYIVHHLPVNGGGQAARSASKNQPPQPVARHTPATTAQT